VGLHTRALRPPEEAMWHCAAYRTADKGQTSGCVPLIRSALLPFPTPPPLETAGPAAQLPAGPVPLSWSPDGLGCSGPKQLDWRSIMSRRQFGFLPVALARHGDDRIDCVTDFDSGSRNSALRPGLRSAFAHDPLSGITSYLPQQPFRPIVHLSFFGGQRWICTPPGQVIATGAR